MSSIQQRAALQRQIWQIANDVRGAVDGWDFKQYVLGTLFYRFISENFSSYIEGGDDSINYAELPDSVITSEIKDDAIRTKGYFIYPSQLFANIAASANTNESLNTDLAAIFSAIESSANGYPSERDIKGLFTDFDTTSNRLGNTVVDKNTRLAAVLKGVSGLDFGDFDDSHIDLFGDAYEFLISNYAANAGKSGGEFFTPQHVSKLIAQLAMHKQTSVNKIYDPACGSGSLLLQAKKHFDAHIIEDGFFGQEINHTTYNLARMNMFLHNINYDKFNIQLGNTLNNPHFGDDKPFDAIVSNPPYSIKWEGSDDPTLINDERFAPAGVLAPKSKADFAFVLHALSYLSSKGRAAIVCFPGIFYRGGAEQKIRQYLVDNNYVETVISLAPNLFFGTTIAVNILVISKHKTDTKTQFIDASAMFKKETNNNVLTDEHIDQIMQAFDSKKDIEYFAKSVPFEDIAAKDYNLSVSSYVEARDNREVVDNRQALLHPDRIREISQHILNNFRQKTHRLQAGAKGFNAMFAVSSVDAAKLYYESFKSLQEGRDKPLRVATIFSFAANEEQYAIGDILDESFEVSAMDSSAKEFLSVAIADYNALFKSNFSVDSNAFQNYYRDLALRVKNQEIDLLIVVGMFLTGFDAPTLNTLFVDKNLRYHGLMQAYSRTNRIFDATKTFGNIVTFRDLEQATIDAITLFGDKNTKNVVLEKSYKEYMEGFTDVATGEARRGFMDVVTELEKRFPNPEEIVKESDKKAFAKLFGEYLRIENVLQNYDEFASLKALQNVDMNDPVAIEAFMAKHYLSDDDLATLQEIKLPAERKIQDCRSTYNDIRDWLRREKSANEKEKSTIDWDDVVFEVDLLKSQEINLDYILELIFENSKKIKDKAALVEDVRRVIRASLGNRAKESLLVDFINQTDLDQIGDKASVIDAFFTFAQAEQQREVVELIAEENLNEEAAKRYITASLKREYASENGTELNAILPKMSPLNPQYLTKKQRVFQKIVAFVEKFKGVGGKV